MASTANTRVVRAPRGPEKTAKTWAAEAALRMMMNNLDPDVAERPEELIVYGGGGKAFDWSVIPVDLGKPIVLSGGLDAGNVVEAIARVRPAAVDVSSGIERAKGIKDAEKMRAFVAAVRSAPD